MLTIINTNEDQDATITDITGVCISTNLDEEVYMALNSYLDGLMVLIAPEN